MAQQERTYRVEGPPVAGIVMLEDVAAGALWLNFRDIKIELLAASVHVFNTTNGCECVVVNVELIAPAKRVEKMPRALQDAEERQYRIKDRVYKISFSDPSLNAPAELKPRAAKTEAAAMLVEERVELVQQPDVPTAAAADAAPAAEKAPAEVDTGTGVGGPPPAPLSRVPPMVIMHQHVVRVAEPTMQLEYRGCTPWPSTFFKETPLPSAMDAQLDVVVMLSVDGLAPRGVLDALGARCHLAAAEKAAAHGYVLERMEDPAFWNSTFAQLDAELGVQCEGNVSVLIAVLGTAAMLLVGAGQLRISYVGSGYDRPVEIFGPHVVVSEVAGDAVINATMQQIAATDLISNFMFLPAVVRGLGGFQGPVGKRTKIAGAWPAPAPVVQLYDVGRNMADIGGSFFVSPVWLVHETAGLNVRSGVSLLLGPVVEAAMLAAAQAIAKANVQMDDDIARAAAMRRDAAMPLLASAPSGGASPDAVTQSLVYAVRSERVGRLAAEWARTLGNAVDDAVHNNAVALSKQYSARANHFALQWAKEPAALLRTAPVIDGVLFVNFTFSRHNIV